LQEKSRELRQWLPRLRKRAIVQCLSGPLQWSAYAVPNVLSELSGSKRTTWVVALNRFGRDSTPE